MSHPSKRNESIESRAWKPIPSCPGYKASEDGAIARFAPARTRSTPYVLPGSLGDRKYKTVKVVVDGRKEVRRVHRLVCEAWHGSPRKNDMHCCHNDGDPSNNHASNLRWDTCKGNLADRKKHGTEMTGDKNGRSKLDWDTVRKIRAEFSGEYGDFSRLSRKYQIADSQIHEIIKQQSWWPEPEAAWESLRARACEPGEGVWIGC